MDSKMNVDAAVLIIKNKILDQGGSVIIPNKRGGYFKARLVKGGIEVDNLGDQPFLPWSIFQESVCILIRNKGTAKRGNAMNARLGDEGLPLDSIEGHIALVVYGKAEGDSVFRRITPVANILEWAGVCKSERGKLILL